MSLYGKYISPGTTPIYENEITDFGFDERVALYCRIYDFHKPRSPLSERFVASFVRMQLESAKRDQKLAWERKSPGWWEAEGSFYRYRAVQVASRHWHLMVFGDGGCEATATYPVTLGDCKSYAQRLENGEYRIHHARLEKV